MMFDFTGLTICAPGELGRRAAELFAQEMQLRTGYAPFLHSEVVRAPAVCIGTAAELGARLPRGEKLEKDGFYIVFDEKKSILTLVGADLRGCIYAFGRFLRKIEVQQNRVTLIAEIDGVYNPHMRIRGHQLGYRPTPNTYDAWMPEDFYRYYRDMMFFGVNICELMPDQREGKTNHLMKLPADEMLEKTSLLADSLDMDVCIWQPNRNEETVEEGIALRREDYAKIPRLDAVFPPGSDPGDFPADEFLARTKAYSKVLKELHPNAEMWPSAQTPKLSPEWGGEFLAGLEDADSGVDGVIHGPNEAMTLDQLRRRLPGRYPIRLYPDITHNVRCTWACHTPYEDWHYAWASTLGREGINPRPAEMQRIHAATYRYIVGSVSYSEGVHDDVNKMIWSDQDFAPGTPIRDTLADYARVFFWGMPVKTVVDAIFGLEQNWMNAPDENPCVEHTYALWASLLEANPNALCNWRFVMHLFRAACDYIVKLRFVRENELVARCERLILRGEFEAAQSIGMGEPGALERQLRSDLEDYAKILHETIGMQMDIARYGNFSSHRGATLETIDLPVTQLRYIQHMLQTHRSKSGKYNKKAILATVFRSKAAPDEFHYSVNLDGLLPVGGKKYLTYMNFHGDNPSLNNGQLPLEMMNIYDDLTFAIQAAGLQDDCGYRLVCAYKRSRWGMIGQTKITADDTVLYEGGGYGGRFDEAFDKLMLPESFVSVTYDIPAGIAKNGCLEITLHNNLVGIEIAEMWILKDEK